MRVIVSYHARDTYSFPDDLWQEAMARCNGDVGEACNILVEDEGDYFFRTGDVTDRYVEAEKE
ncbi:MAG: hypothetical protein LBK13_02340 [Spirochaetales bacterium]|jgi:hypothetical protein|nr:hypothetical protein [Spirochaetales bacterium]